MELKLPTKKPSFKFFGKIADFLLAKYFLTFLILIVIAFVLGGIVFYKYSFLAEKKKAENNANLIVLDEDNLQKVIQIWKGRQEKLDRAGIQSYRNPFIKNTIQVSTSTPKN